MTDNSRLHPLLVLWRRNVVLLMCANTKHTAERSLKPCSTYVTLAAAGEEHGMDGLQVARPQKPPQVLQGNAGEVTGVAWCSTDPTQIVTCHDNATVSVWTLDRSRTAAAKQLVRCRCSSPCAVIWMQLQVLRLLCDRVNSVARGGFKDQNVAQRMFQDISQSSLAERDHPASMRLPNIFCGHQASVVLLVLRSEVKLACQAIEM